MECVPTSNVFHVFRLPMRIETQLFQVGRRSKMVLTTYEELKQIK